MAAYGALDLPELPEHPHESVAADQLNELAESPVTLVSSRTAHNKSNRCAYVYELVPRGQKVAKMSARGYNSLRPAQGHRWAVESMQGLREWGEFVGRPNLAVSHEVVMTMDVGSEVRGRK